MTSSSVDSKKVEDLIYELKGEYTITIATHNMQQATKVADMTAFFNVEAGESGDYTHRAAAPIEAVRH